MRNLLLTVLLFIGLATILGFAAGYYFGYRSTADELNGLLRVGFKVVDPEGYEVESFDDTATGLVHFTLLPVLPR